MSKSKIAVLFIVIVLIGGLTGYYFTRHREKVETPIKAVTGQLEELNNSTTLTIITAEDQSMITRKVKVPKVFDTLKIAHEAAREYIEFYTDANGDVLAKGVEILNLFYGTDKILYLNLSANLIRDFHGDVMDEYLFYKGLYDTMVSNIDISDIKLLVNGEEVKTLGGHFDVSRPLKQIITQKE